MSDSHACCGGVPPLGRRRFVQLTAAAAAAAGARPLGAFAGPFVTEDFQRMVPGDKKLDPAWVASLTARGEPERVRGEDLQRVGLPVGGLFCGTVYLSGDGRLWLWDVFNRNQNGVAPREVQYRGAGVNAQGGAAYVQPLLARDFRVLEQGFVLRVKAGDAEVTRPLSAEGFKEVVFTGQYPIGRVEYRDPAVPLEVDLEAFSPFVPLNADDSSLPATVFCFQLRNPGAKPAEVLLAGHLENAVCANSRERSGTRRNAVVPGEGVTWLRADAAGRDDAASDRPDLVFEDWSKPEYDGWTSEGDAFGRGPIDKTAIPSYQGDVGGDTPRVVNSHATAPGDGVGPKDGGTGTLTSRPFKVERRYINLWVGGGAHKGKTCVDVVVNGKAVRSVTGRSDNKMARVSIDVRAFDGREARLRIVDAVTGPWGNIGVGRIVFGDTPVDPVKFPDLPDFGTMALALLGAPAEDAAASSAAGALDGAGREAEVPLAERLIGRLGRRLTLPPGGRAEVRFVVAWHFPNLALPSVPERGRHYAARFPDAAAVARHVASHADRLVETTRRWRDTWYDGTLPFWFLDRTFANTSILATTTCHRFGSGRFWAWEGIGCCAGTCIHVWHYAQALARLFPEVERDQRERVDFGLALAPDGVIRFRAENGATYAIDGQAGRVLGALREHQMSADGAFLRRVWPGVKRAVQKMIATDGDADGLVFGPLHNTLDADWHGLVPWLAGLYHAALRAAAAMAAEMGEGDFAAACRTIADAGRGNLDRRCWRDELGYYVQEPDAKAAKSIGVYDGCHIDQVLGAAWGRQVGLDGVMDPAHVRRALGSLWRFNFAPDVGPYRDVETRGRWYAMPGDGGLLMVTHPYTPRGEIIGRDHWSFMYFNECMSGFEYQAAAHMVWEGLVTEGLAVTRAIHDRYRAALRNPYNEIECSDHYARAMASYGVFLAACGFECHGPSGHLGLAPRVRPEDFRAPFTAAEGWGSVEQKLAGGALRFRVEVRHGRLRLRTVALELPEGAACSAASAAGKPARAEQKGRRLVVTLPAEASLEAGQSLAVEVKFKG